MAILSKRASILCSHASFSCRFASYLWESLNIASNCVFLCITLQFVSSQCSRSLVTAIQKQNGQNIIKIKISIFQRMYITPIHAHIILIHIYNLTNDICYHLEFLLENREFDSLNEGQSIWQKRLGRFTSRREFWSVRKVMWTMQKISARLERNMNLINEISRCVSE